MINPTQNCYGCRACEEVCPTGAISMLSNDEGFIYPVLNKSLCVDCGACDKVCSEDLSNVEKILNPSSDNVYGAWNSNPEVVLQSTSGGLSATLAEYIIQKGGVAYGCSWRAEDDLVATHRRVSVFEDLRRIKGSKYVQSDTSGSYSQVLSDLKAGLTVLYTGTPCQIAGLKLYLRRDYENLITLDLVCHGVPSPKIFASYVEWLEAKRGARISDFKFRDLNKWGYSIYNSWIENGKRVRSYSAIQPYAYGFSKSYFSRESCYTCVFSQPRRVGDITLSDFWGGERYHVEFKKARKYGYNLVICNTPKAERLLSKISERLKATPSRLEYAMQGDIRLNRSNPRPLFRDQAYKILDDKGFDYLQNTHLKLKYFYIHTLTPEWVRMVVNKILALR